MTPLAPVVVEIAPPDAPAELRRELIEACDRAVKDTRCLEPSGEPEETPAIVAIVSWKDPTHLRLEVAIYPDKTWLVREVEFEDRDLPAERWRAAGLMIGTLAGVAVRGEEPPSLAPREPEEPSEPEEEPASDAPISSPPAAGPEPPAEPPAREAATPPPPGGTTPTSLPAGAVDRSPRVTEAQHRSGWLELVATAGPGLDRGPWRIGGELGLHLRIAASPLGVATGAAFSATAARLDGVTARWMEGFAGVSYSQRFGAAFVAVARADAFVQRFTASVSVTGEEAPPDAGRFIGGARLGAEGLWWASQSFGLVAGAAGWWAAGTTDVRARQKDVASTTPVGFTLRAGATYGFL